MLKLQCVDNPNRYIKLTSFPLTLGKDLSNDFVLDMSRVSDFHAEIHRDEEGLYIVDLLSAGGTFVNDHRVTMKYYLKAWDLIRIGSVTMEISDPNTCRPGSWALRTESDLLSRQFFTLNDKTVVGRDPDCDLSIDWHLLSRRHAEITIEGSQLRIIDLASRNGTYINGCKIKQGFAQPGDEVRFDEQRFVVMGPMDAEVQERQDEDMTGLRERVVPQAVTASTLWPNKDEQQKTLPINAVLISPIFRCSGSRFVLDKNNIGIGRAVDNDLVINDPSVSKKHAFLCFFENRWEINDNNSSNGVTVNGQVIDRVILKNGDRIGIGDSELVFEITGFSSDDTIPI